MTIDIEELDENQLFGTWDVAAFETIVYAIDTTTQDTFTRRLEMTSGVLQIVLNQDGTFTSTGNFTGSTSFSASPEILEEDFNGLGDGVFSLADDQLFLDVLMADENDVVIDPNHNNPDVEDMPFSVDEFEADQLIKLSGFLQPIASDGTVNGQEVVLAMGVNLTLVR